MCIPGWVLSHKTPWRCYYCPCFTAQGFLSTRIFCYAPAHKEIAASTPRLMSIIMIPAKSTPAITAKTVFLNSIFKRLAANVPVQAPVPGNGMPTNRNKATKRPRPAFSSSFWPAFVPLFKKKVHSFPMILLSCPHCKNRLAKR